MASTVASLAFGAVFGLALAAPPGPMNAVIAEESVSRGWLAGVTAGLGAMTADLCFLLLALAGAVTVVESRPTIRAAMVGIGGCLMLWFAYGALRSARQSTTGEVDATGRGFLKTFLLALTNPYQIVFWLTVGVGLLEPGRIDLLAVLPVVGEALAGLLVIRTGSVALLVGLFLGIGVWITAFPASLVRLDRRVDRFGGVVATLSAVVLAGFGLVFLADAARTLL